MSDIYYFHISRYASIEIIPPVYGFFQNPKRDAPKKPGTYMKELYIYRKDNQYFEFFTNTMLIEKRYYNGSRSHFVISGSDARISVSGPGTQAPELKQLSATAFERAVAPWLKIKEETTSALRQHFDKVKRSHPTRDTRHISPALISGYSYIPCTPIPTGGHPLDHYFLFFYADGCYEFFTQTRLVSSDSGYSPGRMIEHSDICFPNGLPLYSASEFKQKIAPYLQDEKAKVAMEEHIRQAKIRWAKAHPEIGDVVSDNYSLAQWLNSH